MNLTIGFKTHEGAVRKSNQDSFAVLRRNDLSNRLDALLVLADGMGGPGGGDIASRMVAQAVPETMLECLYDRSSGSTPPDVEQMLRETFARANHRVWTTRKFERPDLKQMGTTCVAAVIAGDILTVANLGDSRAYLLRAGKLRQLTEDHSEVWQEVMADRMTREEAQKSRFRNRITRAVGLGPEVKTDIFRVPLEEGDTVLLCSDGLNSELRDAEIARIVAAIADIQEVCDRLVDAALDRGGHDNVTVVAVRCGAFTPLTAPITTDEDDTDPEQAWRNRPRERASDDEDEDEEEEAAAAPAHRKEPRPERPPAVPDAARVSRTRTNTTNGVLAGLVLLLGVVAAIEAYLLYQGGMARGGAATPATTVARPAYDLHNYGAPQLLSSKEVQDTCLLIDDQGNPIVASRNGNLIRVRPTGAVELLGGTFPSLPPNKRPATGFAGPARADFAIDPGGNIFSIDPETRSIRVYSRSGTRVGSDIGRDRLTAPVRIGVNADDVLFVIDDNKLYKIEAALLPPGK